MCAAQYGSHQELEGLYNKTVKSFETLYTKTINNSHKSPVTMIH